MSDGGEQFATLLASAARGDQTAIAAQVERYEPKVRVVARVLLGRALRTYVDSVDLVQSVHRSLILGLRNQKFRFTTPEQLIALATTLVRRKVARQWRQAQRQHHSIASPAPRENLSE